MISQISCGTCPQYQKKKKKKRRLTIVSQSKHINVTFLENLEINIRKLNKTKPLRNLTECCDLKQIDCQSFLQQRWVYQKSAEICSSGSATKRSHVQVPMWCRKNALNKGKKEVGKAIVNRVHVFYWQSPYREKEESFYCSFKT